MNAILANELADYEFQWDGVAVLVLPNQLGIRSHHCFKSGRQIALIFAMTEGGGRDEIADIHRLDGGGVEAKDLKAGGIHRLDLPLFIE